MKIRTIPALSAVLILLATLTGCASPTSMVFAPQQNRALQTIYQGQVFSVAVHDQRANKHLLKVIDHSGKKQRYPANTSITNRLQDNFENGLTNQGININDNPSDAHISLSVHQLEAIVEQSRFEYNAAFVVEFKLKVVKGSRTFTKTFTGNADNNGPLFYDVARMEQELNQLVTAVFSTLFNDPQVRQVIEV